MNHQHGANNGRFCHGSHGQSVQEEKKMSGKCNNSDKPIRIDAMMGILILKTTSWSNATINLSMVRQGE
jgi:hypothetical protein